MRGLQCYAVESSERCLDAIASEDIKRNTPLSSRNRGRGERGRGATTAVMTERRRDGIGRKASMRLESLRKRWSANTFYSQVV